MVTDTTGNGLAKVKNPAFRAYARVYSDIERDFRKAIRTYGLDFARDSEGVPTLAPEYELQARHFAYGNVGCVVDWLNGAIEATPAQLAARMFACMPDDLREAYAAQVGW